jgi:hypothetical protein
MRPISVLAAACALQIAAPAPAQDRLPVIVVPDETITLRLDDNRAPVVDRSPATWTEFETAVARRLITGIGVDIGGSATLRSHTGLPPEPEITAGAVRMRFFQIAGRQSVLFIENGEDRALIYRAVMTRNGRSEPTDVCLVPGRSRAQEHWPYPIEQLSLSDLHLVEWTGGETVPCA